MAGVGGEREQGRMDVQKKGSGASSATGNISSVSLFVSSFDALQYFEVGLTR